MADTVAAARSGHRRRARARRRDRAPAGRRRARRDLHLPLRQGRGRRRCWRSCSAAHPQQKFAAHSATSPTRPRSSARRHAREGRPFSGFVHNAGQSYDTLAVMIDQAKAEAAMQVNFWSFTRLATRAGAPDDARQGRPRGRHRLGHGGARQPGQRRLCGLQGRPARLYAHARRRGREPRRHRQLCGAGLHRHRDALQIRQFREKMESQIPANRFATPDDIAGVVGFLLSPHAAYITGAYLPVDGGLTAALGIHR